MKEDIKVNDDFEIIRGSGNVFHDFGYANADLEQARAILAKEIIHTLDDRCLSTREAEKLTGVAHSEFSRIRNAKLSRFTLDRMITIFGKLVEDVEVNVSFRPRQHAEAHGLWLSIPKSMHSSLAKNAVEEGVSLNSWVLTLLSEKSSASSIVGQFESLAEVIKTDNTVTRELVTKTKTVIATIASNSMISPTIIPPIDLNNLKNGFAFNSATTIGTC